MHRVIVEGMLWPVWVGMPAEYKAKYARTIWQQFEDNIRSAAYTSSLRRFLQVLCGRLGVEVRSEHLMAIERILGDGDDAAVLKLLREETMALVILVRLKNEERKAK